MGCCAEIGNGGGDPGRLCATPREPASNADRSRLFGAAARAYEVSFDTWPCAGARPDFIPDFGCKFCLLPLKSVASLIVGGANTVGRVAGATAVSTNPGVAGLAGGTTKKQLGTTINKTKRLGTRFGHP